MASDESQKPEKRSPLRLLADNEEARAASPQNPWVGTDLAKFAQDVIALNRQADLSPQSTKSGDHKCRVASLESLQRGLKIRRGPEPDVTPEKVAILRSHRKE